MKYKIIAVACITLTASTVLLTASERSIQDTQTKQLKVQKLNAEYEHLYTSWKKGNKSTVLILKLWKIQQILTQKGISKTRDWEHLFNENETQACCIVADHRICAGPEPTEEDASIIDELLKLCQLNASLTHNINLICSMHKLAPCSASNLRNRRSSLMKQVESLMNHFCHERHQNHQLTQQLEQYAQEKTTIQAKLEQERRAHLETIQRAERAEHNALVIMQQFVQELDRQISDPPAPAQPTTQSEKPLKDDTDYEFIFHE